MLFATLSKIGPVRNGMSQFVQRFMHSNTLENNGPLVRSLILSGVFLFFLLLFFVQPFLTFSFLVVVSLIERVKSPGFIYMIAFFGSCYLGLVNVTKFPDGDLVKYLEWYASAQEFSLPAFLAIFSREPAYYIYLHTIANLPFASERFFVFASTVVGYLIFMFAVIRASLSLRLSVRVVVCIAVALMFFAPLFSLSAHLMRQFIAASLVILFFSESLLLGRRYWWMLIVAILVHYSAILFLLLAMMKKPDRASSGIGVFSYFSVLPILYFLSNSTASLFADMPVLGFVFSRVAAEGGAELEHLSHVAIFFAVAMITLSITNLKASPCRMGSMSLFNHGWRINTTAIILGVIVLVSNLLEGATEIATRFYFYMYFLLGLVLPIFFSIHRRLAKLIFPSLGLLFAFFFYNSQFGAWRYASLNELLFLPAWELWCYRV